jgi:hypothetical protein
MTSANRAVNDGCDQHHDSVPWLSQSFPRRVLRRGFWRWARNNVKAIGLITLGVVLLAVLVSLFDPSSYGRGLTQGGLAVALVAAVWLMYLMTSGAVYELGGAWGEDNTRTELNSARRRGLIWGAVHSIEVAGVDIDHLVLAPAGAFAIDSKWHFGELQRWALDRDVTRAIEGARKAESVLRSTHVQTPMKVTPLVVVWGRGQRELPDEGIEHEGVWVVAGADLKRWLDRVRLGPVAEDNASRVLRALDKFAEERRGKRPLPQPRPVGSGLRR